MSPHPNAAGSHRAAASLLRACLAAMLASFVMSLHAQTLLQVSGAGGRIPIELARVNVAAQVVGLAARTRIELEFRNPNNHVLEGELQFPLQEGQVVTGFALDIDGELRPAVPVEKAKGRQVFEDVTRTRVDPALLESTQGNNYRLRIYPLPARGTRRVVLEIAGTLTRAHTGGRASARYVVPLDFAGVVQRLDVSVQLPQLRPSQRAGANLGAQRLPLRRAKDGSAVLDLSRTAYAGKASLHVDIEQDVRAPQVSTGEFRDASYFYAEVPVEAKEQPRRDPVSLGIVWDASGSGAARDHALEFALLERYFQAIGNVEVELSVVRNVAEPVRRFSVLRGDWRALRHHLDALPYDGATRVDHMVVPPGADVALLFSDGLGNYGEGGLPASRVPVYAIKASTSADVPRLRQLAEASGGKLVDLASLSPEAAVRELRSQRTRLVGLNANGATVLVAEGRYPHHGRLVLAGRLTQPQAEVVLELEAPNGSRSTRRIPVAHGAAAGPQPAAPVAPHRWATLRLAELEANHEQNREAIRRLGTHFGLVSTGTSLIVLDAVADYVRHEIEPTASLRPAYESLLAQRRRGEELARQNHIQKVVERFAARQAWWDKDFPKGEKPRPPEPTKQEAEHARQAAMASAQQRQQQRASAPPPATVAAPAARMPPPAAALTGAAAPAGLQAAAGSAIALQKWAPDSPYTRRLRAAGADSLYAVYLDERPSHTSSTAFFLDAADIFFERGQPELAHRILSNLAEMQLENRHILRILAYRLLQAGQVKAALPLLKKVLALSPDEPQSYRDLGLALASDGQFQPAAEQLWRVASRPWNNRFPDIEQVALAELNAVRTRASAAGVTVDTTRMDPRLLHNLPLALRAVLAWDADNTDIDLHVIDPNGEEASYARQLTYQGGRMSNDFTGGYGPEEFSLRHAKPGTYTVKARFYGHRQQIVAPATTLMLRLTTDFGTPRQKDSDVVLRLSGEGQMVTVGTFEVRAGAGGQSESAAAAR